jgi:hypothetical protein
MVELLTEVSDGRLTGLRKGSMIDRAAHEWAMRFPEGTMDAYARFTVAIEAHTEDLTGSSQVELQRAAKHLAGAISRAAADAA